MITQQGLQDAYRSGWDGIPLVDHAAPEYRDQWNRGAEASLKAKDDGGPAFPVQDVGGWDRHGMTLRDYFAAKCPITWSEAQDYNTTGADEMMFFVTIRYQYADRMIAERAA